MTPEHKSSPELIPNEYQTWPELMDLVQRAVERGQHEMLLTLLTTQDERDALIARSNILCELLKGNLSQRQMSQMLGVGVATITRGSNGLKAQSDEQKQQLSKLLMNDN